MMSRLRALARGTAKERERAERVAWASVAGGGGRWTGGCSVCVIDDGKHTEHVQKLHCLLRAVCVCVCVCVCVRACVRVCVLNLNSCGYSFNQWFPTRRNFSTIQGTFFLSFFLSFFLWKNLYYMNDLIKWGITELICSSICLANFYSILFCSFYCYFISRLNVYIFILFYFTIYYFITPPFTLFIPVLSYSIFFTIFCSILFCSCQFYSVLLYIIICPILISTLFYSVLFYSILLLHVLS